jgi:hypothetical protein
MTKKAQVLSVVVAGIAGYLSLQWVTTPLPRQEARWFMPGYWGYEHGSAASAPGKEAWLTRSMDIGGKPGEKSWHDFNQLGSNLNFIHNLSNIVRIEDRATHPEWFPLVGGERYKPDPARVNWQPDLASEAVVAHAADIAAASLRSSQELRSKSPRSGTGNKSGSPGLPVASFGLGINDALIFGESPEVLSWVYPPRYFRDRPDYSNLIFHFTNRVAEEVEKRMAAAKPAQSASSSVVGRELARAGFADPDADANDEHGLSKLKPYTEFADQIRHGTTKVGPYKGKDWLLGCLAYYWCEQVPDFPVHPNVVPYLCADRSQFYDQAFRAEERELQTRWGAKGPKRLGLYDYLDGYGFAIPRIHTQALIDNLKHAHGAGFTDYFGEASQNWGLEGPQSWLVAQLLAHPEAEGKELLDEYYSRYFAEAAGPMRAYFERCEQIWMSQPAPSDWLKYFRNESQAELFPSSECERLRALLTEAQTLARSEKVRHRVALVSAAFGATERLAKMWEAKKAVSYELVADPKASSSKLVAGSSELIANSSKLIAFSQELVADSPDASGPELMANSSKLKAMLSALERAEADFKTYVAWLDKAYPLALYKGAHPDFFWMSPASAAREFLTAARNGPPTLLRSASLDGPKLPGLWIAGLQYRLSLPEGWIGKMEPAEAARAELCPEASRTGKVGLRLSNQRYASVGTWQHLTEPNKTLVISAYARGHLSPAGRVLLQVNFVDGQNKLMPQVYGMRYIPIEGWNSDRNQTPAWEKLLVSVKPPAGAIWLSVSIVTAYMMKGDTADVADIEIGFRE